MKKVQHENCHSEIRKRCTRIGHYSAQTDNGPFLDRSLYTGHILIDLLKTNKLVFRLMK